MSKYAQSKHQFFHSGVDNQKTPDISIDLKRISSEKISQWTDEEKLELIKWMTMCKTIFHVFTTEILQPKPATHEPRTAH